MSHEWRSIESAPRDGSPIKVYIPGYGGDNVVVWMDGFLDAAEQDCCGWVFFYEDADHPPCWTDGACWESNENAEPSIQPTHWRLL